MVEQIGGGEDWRGPLEEGAWGHLAPSILLPPRLAKRSGYGSTQG